jgi:hypothetical protein
MKGAAANGAHGLLQHQGTVALHCHGFADVRAEAGRQPDVMAIGAGQGCALRGRLRHAYDETTSENCTGKQAEARCHVKQLKRPRTARRRKMSLPKGAREDGGVAWRIGDDVFRLGHPQRSYTKLASTRSRIVATSEGTSDSGATIAA